MCMDGMEMCEVYVRWIVDAYGKLRSYIQSKIVNFLRIMVSERALEHRHSDRKKAKKA